MIDHLREKSAAKEEIESHFLISDQAYSKAAIPPTDKVITIIIECSTLARGVFLPPLSLTLYEHLTWFQVCLWLGANVMLEYSLDEAEKLLKKNLESAESSVQQIAFDLDYLRDQMTITEVTMARLYNWDVKKRNTNKASNAVAAS